jgi:hypothetical protein
MLLQVAARDIRQLTDIELHVQMHVQNGGNRPNGIIRRSCLLAMVLLVKVSLMQPPKGQAVTEAMPPTGTADVRVWENRGCDPHSPCAVCC